MTKRISLKEASKSAPRMLARGDSALLEEGAPPTLNDLAGALQFALGDGRIWLNDERMVLLQTSVLGDLRRAMIEALGLDSAASLFRKTGWQQGVELAELVTKRFHQEDLTNALAAGPRLHTMEGYVKVTTKRFEFDVARGHYHGEFHWHDSTEAAEHIRHFGLSDTPACWFQLGVPSGYTSTLLGQPVIFREVECMAQGAERCVVIGRNAAAWGDDVPELEEFGLARAKTRSKPWTPPVALPEVQEEAPDPDAILGKSAAIERARRLLERVAGYDEPVMLLGDPGTGKELFARRLHKIGRAANGPFVVVNCGIFDTGHPEEDLFSPGGAIERAAGGTLFLNDILALPIPLQGRLVTLLDARGEQKPGFRLISATGDDPRAALDAGRLRADLFYRLSLLPIALPPLRDRRDDLPQLIDHFRRLHARRHGKPIRQLSGAAMDMLLRYDYPGNVRELSNMIERGVIYAEPGGDVDISHLFTGIEEMPAFVEGLHATGKIVRRSAQDGQASGLTLQDIETEAIQRAMDEAGGNVSAAARALGLTRAKLDYRLAKLGIKPGK